MISAPLDFVHEVHVGFDTDTGEFSGLPDQWSSLLSVSGVTKKELAANPQGMLDVLGFYTEGQENGTMGGDTKFMMEDEEKTPKKDAPKSLAPLTNERARELAKLRTKPKINKIKTLKARPKKAHHTVTRAIDQCTRARAPRYFAGCLEFSFFYVFIFIFSKIDLSRIRFPPLKNLS